VGSKVKQTAVEAAPFGVDVSLQVFDRATLVARGLFPGSEAMVILVKDGVTWRSRVKQENLPERDRVAERVIATGEMIWIADGLADPAYANNPLVVNPPYLRAYIGAPIRREDGTTPGVLTVLSTKPIPHDPSKAAQLQGKIGEGYTPEQADKEFRAWYDQNVSPYTASLQAAQEEALYARQKDQAASQVSAYTAAQAAGRNTVDAWQAQAPYRVGPNAAAAAAQAAKTGNVGDLSGAAFQCANATAEGIAEGILEALHEIDNKTEKASQIAANAAAWREEHAYENLGRRLSGMCLSLVHQY